MGEWTPEYFLLVNNSRMITIVKNIDERETIVFSDDNKVFLVEFGDKIQAQNESTKEMAHGFEI